MNEEEKKIESRLMPYRFWLFAALSAFLVMMFVYYLPLRFLAQSGMAPDGSMMMANNGSMAGHAHGPTLYHEASEVKEGLTVDLSASPLPVMSGTTTQLDFFVNQKPGNIPVTDLEIEHEKLVHVLGVRDDMNEFFHIHPEVGASFEGAFGYFITDHIFSNPGRYKLWTQIKKDGVVHTFGHPEIEVERRSYFHRCITGDTRCDDTVNESYDKQVSFGRSVIAGNYQVALSISEPVAKGIAQEFAFDLHSANGQEIKVEPYLGADMHLAIIKDDWKQFIHTHPDYNTLGASKQSSFVPSFIQSAHANGAHTNMPPGGQLHGIGFKVVFPEAGLYKIFAQFRPQGIGLPADEALTASFWIKVDEEKAFAVSRVTLVVISLALIALLSFGVKRFLKTS